VGNITGALGDLQLDSSDISPKATDRINLSLTLNAGATVPGGPQASSVLQFASAGAYPVLDTNDSPISQAVNLVDSFGNPVAGTMTFTYDAVGSQWQAQLATPGGVSAPVNFTPGTAGAVNLTWDADGAGSQAPVQIDFDPSTFQEVSVGGGTDLTVTAGGGIVQGPFDPTDAATYNNSTSLTIYDSLGTPQLATMYYRKTAVPNQWESYLYVGDQQVAGAQPNGSTLLQFSADGTISSINGTATPPNIVSMAAVNPGNGAQPITLSMDYGAISQWGGGFNIASLNQNGYATGRLSSIDIDNSGVIFARFTNGETRTLGQIALANFSNPQGLAQLGENRWGETFASGDALVAAPGSSGLGVIESGALEGSNVDLSEQLVRMIVAQRNFQANAQVISTADTITQTIINLR
jgi:flagellar hook protein FlgE